MSKTLFEGYPTSEVCWKTAEGEVVTTTKIHWINGKKDIVAVVGATGKISIAKDKDGKFLTKKEDLPKLEQAIFAPLCEHLKSPKKTTDYIPGLDAQFCYKCSLWYRDASIKKTYSLEQIQADFEIDNET